MERFLKYFAGFIIIFSFCLIVYASQEEVDKAEEAMEQYCLQSKELKGCVYDPNDPLYTQSGSVYNWNFWIKVKTPSKLPLVRGYATANAQGEIIFAGCYKGHFDDGDWVKAADYYVFKIVALDGGKCKVIDSDIAIAKGTKFKKNYFFRLITGWDGEFDGGALGADMANYIDWIAENDGECPLYFGLTANTRWYTSAKNKYLFANDLSGFNTGVKSFWGGEEYKAIAGCTDYDKKGYELAKVCFDEASNKIENTKCPSDYSDLSKLASTLEVYQDSCDNRFRKLYSQGLLEEQADEFKKELKTQVKKKLSTCQFNQCKVTDAQQQKIESNLKKDNYMLCSAGKCPAGNYAKQSTSEDAKCYRIGNGTSAYFEWTDKPSGQPASVEKNISKSECYGTYDTRNCRDCLKKVYKASDLSETQINCMLEIEGEKSSIENQSEEEINKQFDDKNEEKLKEGQEKREELYKSYETPEVEVPEIPTEDPNIKTCEQILGKNLTTVLKVAITIIQVVGAIIAIVKGMMELIPPIISKDAEALKKASKTLVNMAIILVIIFLFRPLLKFLGNIVGFDTSCIV